jgi:ribose transport system ATP-binding protein
VLILDEPTASLTEKETATLFRLIAVLKQNQTAVIYISHRLAEIFQIADKVTVLKDGKYQGTELIHQTSPEQLIKTMVGRTINELNKPDYKIGEILLEVDKLSGTRFSDCSFSIHRGEILALAGLAGAGRSEIARVLFGLDKRISGTMRYKNEWVEFDHPADAIRKGIAYVPEDRKAQGLFLEMSVRSNINSTIIAGDKWMNEQDQKITATDYQNRLHIQTPSLDQPIKLLSGGNQQKCVLARWLQLAPQLLIVDEPTQGIDIGTKYEIYQLLIELAASGTSILLISSELPEVLALADRTLVLHAGRMVGTLTRGDASEERILSMASDNTP